MSAAPAKGKVKPTAKAAARSQKSPGRKGGRSLLLWFGLAVLLVGAFPTCVVLGAGLLPTLVAYLSDRHRDKNATRCMLAMNLAGVAPVVMMLWSGGNTVDQALGLLTDVYNWLFMLGAAAMGVAVLSLIPRAVAYGLLLRARQRHSSLKLRQRKLVEEWGEAVTGASAGD